VIFLGALVTALPGPGTFGQQLAGPAPPTVAAPASITGGQGILWLSQFANPALIGSLYLTPAFPLTGFYPLYPAAFAPLIAEEGVSVGPLLLHPHMGAAAMYTDNVFRTNTNRRDDVFLTLSPGIQAQLPIAGRHRFLLDYRTNVQYYQDTPSNDVQDQTGSGRFTLDFPGGLKFNLQGEHKLGHDPRGSAVDIQSLEVNKWTSNSIVGQAEYVGAQVGVVLRTQTIRWDYLNNNQAVIRDRLSHYAGMTLLGSLGPKTFALANVGVIQEIYDQNKNLDSAIYLVSGGLRWDVTALTTGEIQVGYQFLKFSRTQVDQPGPLLSLFRRDRDEFSNFFLSGNVYWHPSSTVTVGAQAYRTIQQTPLAGTQFFIATGVNLSVIHQWSDRLRFSANLGYETDAFSGAAVVGGATVTRSDTLKNVSVGFTYRTVKWLGATFQYAFEDRSSVIDAFAYRANTFTVALEAAL
jgi:Putative beta-barrel porin 2